MTKSKVPFPVETITRAILVVRGHRVILDAELATLYGVSTKRFNEQVRRNLARFPADFMFRLNQDEQQTLRSHFATSNYAGRGGRRYLPYAFTEHGAIMAATILNSPRAVEMSVYVVRAFVKLRELLATSAALSRKLDELEQKLQTHDRAIVDILKSIRELTKPAPPETAKRGIGFTADLERKS